MPTHKDHSTPMGFPKVGVSLFSTFFYFSRDTHLFLFIYFCGFCAVWWFIICGNWDCFVLRFVYVFHFYCHGFWCQFTIILQAPINEWKLQWEINPPCSKPTPQLQCYYILCSLGHATLWHSVQYPLQFYAMFRIAYKILHWSLSLYQFLS